MSRPAREAFFGAGDSRCFPGYGYAGRAGGGCKYGVVDPGHAAVGKPGDGLDTPSGNKGIVHSGHVDDLSPARAQPA